MKHTVLLFAFLFMICQVNAKFVDQFSEENLATCADLLGFESTPNSAIDSRSFLDAIFNKVDHKDRWAIKNDNMCHCSRKYILYKDEWKLILASYHNSNLVSKNELYNIVKDPYEKTNLAKSYPDVVKRLAKRVAEIDAKKSSN